MDNDNLVGRIVNNILRFICDLILGPEPSPRIFLVLGTLLGVTVLLGALDSSYASWSAIAFVLVLLLPGTALCFIWLCFPLYYLYGAVSSLFGYVIRTLVRIANR